MDLFSRALARFGVGGLANVDDGAQFSGPSTRSTEAGIVVSDERALQVSAVWSCVRLIAEVTAILNLVLATKTPRGNVPLKPEHPLSLLFKRKPNPMMTPLELREAMTMQLALWGNAYGLIQWNTAGTRPLSIVPLKPEAVQIHKMGTELTYHYSTSRGVDVFSQRSIFHLKGFSVDGIVGLSPLAYARHVLGITVSADKYASAFFANGGRPGGVLTIDKWVSKEQREKLKKLYSQLNAGPSNLQGLWVLEGGMKYDVLDLPPGDMQMLQSRTFQISEIARFFRVPGHLINDTEKATSWGTGLEQFNRAFLTYTLRPYLRKWETVIVDALQPQDWRTLAVSHDTEELLEADSERLSNVVARHVQNGLMSRNEGRSKLKLPPSDQAGADDLTVQVNLTPLQQLERINATQD